MSVIYAHPWWTLVLLYNAALAVRLATRGAVVHFKIKNGGGEP